MVPGREPAAPGSTWRAPGFRARRPGGGAGENRSSPRARRLPGPLSGPRLTALRRRRADAFQLVPPAPPGTGSGPPRARSRRASARSPAPGAAPDGAPSAGARRALGLPRDFVGLQPTSFRAAFRLSVRFRESRDRCPLRWRPVVHGAPRTAGAGRRGGWAAGPRPLGFTPAAAGPETWHHAAGAWAALPRARSQLTLQIAFVSLCSVSHGGRYPGHCREGL